eukprot:scaffold125646_cov30-Tisochrysis_lutea.AAC.2
MHRYGSAHPSDSTPALPAMHRYGSAHPSDSTPALPAMRRYRSLMPNSTDFFAVSTHSTRHPQLTLCCQTPWLSWAGQTLPRRLILAVGNPRAQNQPRSSSQMHASYWVSPRTRRLVRWSPSYRCWVSTTTSLGSRAPKWVGANLLQAPSHVTERAFLPPVPPLLSSQDLGIEKPDRAIFDRAFEQARFWLPDLERHEMLHIGDSLAADFCGARAAGMQALLLDRSYDPRVVTFQVEDPPHIAPFCHRSRQSAVVGSRINAQRTLRARELSVDHTE